MIINEKITAFNYKCFDSTGGGFDKIFPINIIISKNNSGKSSLIDLIRFVVDKNNSLNGIGRDTLSPDVLIEHKLTEGEIAGSFSTHASKGGIPGPTHYDYGINFINKTLTYKLGDGDLRYFLKIDEGFIDAARQYFDRLTNKIQVPLRGKIFCNISSERDIQPESPYDKIEFSSGGVGGTNIIQEIINKTHRDSRLIENELLQELNKIVNPDIKFTRILVQLNKDGKWELFFEDFNNKRIALSNMGSGVKTILLVLLNLIVRPQIEGRKSEDYVFAFEELENNLHPSLQRRLYLYIKDYSVKHSAYFFLTTHSNIVIDTFGTYENSQIIHVTNDGKKSETNTILSLNATKKIVNDLGVKASDILQSNGIIWVEGPSDRVYLNTWIKLLSPELKEGIHYLIMFYGGRLLSNLTFDFDWLNKELIPLLKINRNAFVVIDKDGKRVNDKLNSTKSRIEVEVGKGNCWITQGREIENYLSNEIISSWLSKRFNENISFIGEKYTKLEDSISKLNMINNLQYNLSKSTFSSEIAEHINKSSINFMDLKSNLDRLISEIKIWNE